MGRFVIELVQTSQFKQDLKRVKHSGRYSIDDLLQVVELLKSGESLPEKYKEHNLHGNWQHYKECHVKPDWLLIYKLSTEQLVLARTGSHSELF